MRIHIYTGKWYIAIRFKNDLCIGLGRPDARLRSNVVRTRAHRGI